ncbi:MAG: BamA/TamA family outer membrane protein, partial [Bacteroidota bacterium]|nr:BamA/TamA family outer membrane protein [Bacteroidota bacterium]
QLSYVQEEKPSDLTLLGTGSVLNLYLKAKKNSQINLLVGFLPNSDQSSAKKFQLTGEANILLRNALSIGETIGLNWQKLQPQSQRLNLLYEQPFVFKSPVGLGFNFDMFRKDSTFLNIDMKLAANYGIGVAQTASVFLQRRQTIVNGVNTTQVIFTKQLPQEGDVSSNNLGISYEYNNTDNRLNPRKGAEFFIITSAGNKKIKKNSQVLELKDPANPSFKFESLYDTVKLKTYQLRLNVQAARYFPLGGLSVFKTAINAGIYQSGNIYRNELFQIGGYKLLRGFDEESQYVSQYAVGTLEYRFIINTNSNFFAFADGGWGRHSEKLTHTYISTGLGISFETKAGVFNLVWALGKRDDTGFNLRQSKIHLGFVNYF